MMSYRNFCTKLHKMSMRILDVLTAKSYGKDATFGKFFDVIEKYKIQQI